MKRQLIKRIDGIRQHYLKGIDKNRAVVNSALSEDTFDSEEIKKILNHYGLKRHTCSQSVDFEDKAGTIMILFTNGSSTYTGHDFMNWKGDGIVVYHDVSSRNKAQEIKNKLQSGLPDTEIVLEVM